MREAPFRLFYASFVISLLGDTFRLLVVNVWIYTATSGSPYQRLFLVVLGNLPGVLLGGVAGVLADRWKKYRILVSADLLRFIGGLGLVWCAAASAPGLALPLVALGNALGVFFGTAAFSLLPVLVANRDLARTNGLMEASQWVVRIVGPAAAGLVLALAGAPAALLADSLSFLVSACFLAALSRVLVRKQALSLAAGDLASGSRQEATGEKSHPWQDFVRGLQIILTNRSVRSLLLASYGVTYIAASTNYALIFMVAKTLHKNPAILGALYSLNGVVAVSAAGAAAVFLRNRHLESALTFSILGLCLAQVLMGLAPNVWILGCGVVVSALSNAPYNISISTLYMQRVPERYLGRVSGVDTMVDNAVSILAFLLAVLVVEVANPRAVFILSAVMALPALVLAARGVWRPPAARDPDSDCRAIDGDV